MTFKQLLQLGTLLNPANGTARWNLLQDWLAKNPDKKEMIETAASLPQAETLVYLLSQINLDANLLKQFDPTEQVVKQAEGYLAELQKLYNERKEFDPADSRRIGSPGKKGKEKVIKNAFDQMNNLPVTERE